jgi:hypothetical protein
MISLVLESPERFLLAHFQSVELEELHFRHFWHVFPVSTRFLINQDKKDMGLAVTYPLIIYTAIRPVILSLRFLRQCPKSDGNSNFRPPHLPQAGSSVETYAQSHESW